MHAQDSFSSVANAAAVESVLAAERAAELALQAERERALAVLSAARARAGAIFKRSDERISRLHVAMEARIEAEIARRRRDLLSFEVQPANDPHVGIGREALARAVSRLAARMTGEDGVVR